jgi:hypothetical protein
MTVSQSTVRSGGVPGRKWYAVALLVLLAGVTGFFLILTVTVLKFGDDFVRVTVPGQAELPLDPGIYTIFHEQGGTTDGVGGGVITAGDVSGLRISVHALGGAIVPLKADASGYYSINGRSGDPLFTFAITEPGTYQLAAAYDDRRSGPPAVLAIARDFNQTVMKTVLAGLASAFVSVAAAIAIALYVHRRRRRAAAVPSRE